MNRLNNAKPYDLEADVKKWLARKSAAEKKIRYLNERLEQRKCDQQEILLEHLRPIAIHTK